MGTVTRKRGSSGAFKARVQRGRPRYCAKCGTEGPRQLHHIVPVRLGGRDMPENAVLLCKSCHREWHECWEGTPEADLLRFDRWLELPPARIVVYAIALHCATWWRMLRPMRDSWKAVA